MFETDYPTVTEQVKLGKWPSSPQLKKLAVALFRGERLTTFRAAMKYGVLRLSERMRELQALGWGINKGWMRTETGANVMEYWL